MRVGTQFSDTLAGGATHKWFTHSWPAGWHVVWTVVPTTAGPGAAQIEWQVEVQRSTTTNLTYWLTIHNLSAAAVGFEARFEVLN